MKEKIYFQDGSLRDIFVLNVTKKDWDTWAKFVNKNYKVEFINYSTHVAETQINLKTISGYLNNVYCPEYFAKIFVGNILVQVYFFYSEEFENDINPTEIKSLEDHNNLMIYLKSVSKVLNKELILTTEEIQNRKALIRINGDEVFFNFAD